MQFVKYELNHWINMQSVKPKNDRLETLRMLFSSQELCSQDDVLKALTKEGQNHAIDTLARYEAA